MASASLGSAVRQLARIFGAGTVAGLDEVQLLERFLARGDELAFEAIVARHGPMVLAVCRRFLDDPHAVEDAFQATFLVLVRRARSIRDAGRLGPWLYGVALRVARRTRSEQRRRQSRERGGEIMAEHEPRREDGPVDDRGPVLHEEIERLPSRYRDVLVVCDLEGRTHEEAARLLRCPVGTVKGRLHRARERLRGRLERRGLALGSTALATILAGEAAASVPPALMELTVRAAIGLAAGGSLAAVGTGSAVAIGLSHGVVKTMFWCQMKTLALGLATAGTLATASGALAYQYGGAGLGGVAGGGRGAPPSEAAQEKAKAGAAVKSVPAGEDAVAQARRNLAQARVAVAEHVFDELLKQIQGGVLSTGPGQAGPEARARSASLHVLATDREENAGDFDEAAALQAHLERMKKLHAAITELGNRDNRGLAGMVDPSTTALYVAEAELWLTEVKAGREPTGLDDEIGDTFPLPVGGFGAMMAGGGEMMAGPGMMRMGGMPPGRPATGSRMRSAPATAGAAMSGPAAAGTTIRAADGDTEEPPAEPAAKPTVDRSEPDARTKTILAALDQPVDLDFPDETPLSDVLDFVRKSTTGPELPGGVPLYVDPSGLGEMTEEDKTERELLKEKLIEPVSLKLEGVPLKTGLRLLLKQVGLSYAVKDGIVLIGATDSHAFRQELEDDAGGGAAVPGYGAMPASGKPRRNLPGMGGGMGGMGGGMGGMGGGMMPGMMGGMGGGLGGSGMMGGSPGSDDAGKNAAGGLR